MGHVSRGFEEAGIPTVIVQSGIFRLRAEQMKPPRVLLTRNIFSRPISAPHDVERQRDVLQAAFRLLETAEHGGTIQDMPGRFRSGRAAAGKT